MWIMDMEKLLKVARIPNESSIDVVQIQLMDVVRIWWLPGEKRHTKSMTWEKFIKAFYDRCFHPSN